MSKLHPTKGQCYKVAPTNSARSKVLHICELLWLWLWMLLPFTSCGSTGEAVADSALSKALQTNSTTSLPRALFCWNFSAHFCSIFAAMDFSAGMEAHVMLVSCRNKVQSEFSGCGRYEHFSSTSTKSFKVTLRVTISKVRLPLSTMDSSKQWHTFVPMRRWSHQGPGAFTVIDRVVRRCPSF